MMGGLLLAVLYFARPATFLLIPALTVLVPIVVVTTHWLGLNVQQVQSFRSIASGILIATVAGVAGPMSARDPDEWMPIVPVTAVAVVTIFSVYAIYEGDDCVALDARHAADVGRATICAAT